ncbi:hypothetical protein [Streptomyces sp. NPDC057199]|uniref:hypothetical protein n=1 Tax=Streptomyces sp. NPDC057199 TaxID=3346047 RepID=UPI003638AAAC
MGGPPATATAVRARDHARIFLSIAREHPELGSALVRDLCRAFPAQDEIVAVVLSEGGSVLTQHPEVVRDECHSAAADGDLDAVRALVISGADDTVVRELVCRRLRTFAGLLRNDQHIGTDAYALAWLARDVSLPEELVPLADACAAQAGDHSRSSDQRKTALTVLSVIADRLDDDARARYYPSALAAARGELDGSSDDALPLPNHPLGRSRFNLGPTTLRYHGLQAAACLAVDDVQAADTLTIAWQRLPHADEREAGLIADALNCLTIAHPLLDPAVLAGHGSSWIRALAAARWSQRPDTHPHLGRLLTEDPHRRVRGSLAACLPDDQTALLAQLRDDPRRSVRNAARRSGSSG